ncbi:extracellular solute-binding protein [Gracilibacillus alcaliphilus]|uniref:extracellular solute-binding protein n=1 Tax=Gracilibacillus alcaliphilus TaxID=1401441 RepID=UPI00195AFC7C|nr:extracellular solute-binding protein [Gracilibacillus alcaliphilus]MBM7679059.1 putative aldouronate transport system substrate-binding protein [Gracilibacillus alcaliphilus]
MKKKQSLLFLFLMVIGLILAACNQEESSGGSEQNTDSGDKDPLGKYEETVTFTQVLGHGQPEDPNTKQGVTPQTNGYVTKLKDMLNIDIQYDWTVPTEQFEQKFSLSIASGDLPDVMTVDMQQFERFKNQGILADLTDVYNDYASDEIKSYNEFDDGKTLELFKQDGQLLGIPSFEDPYMSAQFLWIRKDWLDHLGLDEPTSLEELEEVAQAFVDEDPDGNGQNDTYGIALNQELISWGFDARGLFYTMGAYPKAWINDGSGQLVPGETLPETKEALELMSNWYQTGIIDKEFGLKDIEQAIEDIVSGKVGITFGEWWYPNHPLNTSKDQNPEADWIPLELPTYQGEESKTLIPSLRLGHVVVVNKEFEHPEAAIKAINFYPEMSKPDYADEVSAENGYVYNWYQPKVYQPDDFMQAYEEVNQAIEEGVEEIDSTHSTSIDLFNEAQKYLDGDESAWGMYYSRVAPDGGWGVVERIRESGNVIYDEFAGGTTPTMVSKGSSLDKLTDETFVKIIMGTESIDAFDDYVKSWNSLGGEDITAEVNEWYQENQ